MDFLGKYKFSVLRDLPSGDGVLRFSSPGAAGSDGVIVRVTPLEASTWVGVFAYGGVGEGVTDVTYTPKSEEICVVSNGLAYLVNVRNPSAWQAVPSVPVKHLIPLHRRRVLVFGDDTDLVAYGVEGQLWRSERIALNGFSVTNTTCATISGVYYDAAYEEDRLFVVDARSGEVRRLDM